MPHSIKGSADSAATFSLDLLGPLNTNPVLHSKPGIAVSFSTRPVHKSTTSKRNSLPNVDAWADLHGRTDPRDFQQKLLGDRNSMIANHHGTSKQRAQFPEDQYQYKEHVTSSVRDRVQRESPVIAELRTNVIVKDEFTLVTDLSYHLATRYTRPDSAIMVKVDHSACLALGGTFDPCYILTITTVPSQMGPTRNKRNAALIQSFMADILSVPPERGVLKFTPIPEENYAINGTTILGEIEAQEKQQISEGSSAVRRVMSNGRRSMPSFKKGVSKLDTVESSIAESHVDTQESLAGNKETSSARTVSGLAREDRRRSTSQMIPVTTILSTDGVFELAAGDLDSKKRPSTAHSHTASVGSNGLRMNGISDALALDLTLHDPTLPNGRPRTFAGAPSSAADRLHSEAVSEPPRIEFPARQSSVSPAKRQSSVSSQKTESLKNASTTSRAFSAPQVNKPLPLPSDAKPRPRDSYLDGLLGKSSSMKDLSSMLSGKPSTIPEQPAQEKASSERGTDKVEATANTAKRRSTINISALPKMPPPPIPETSDAKSTKSLRVGKRKSFMAALRRSTTRASEA